MADIQFEDLLSAAQKLSPEQKQILAQSLDVPAVPLTREMVFDKPKSLRNAYANPAAADLTPEQLPDDLNEIRAAWAAEMDKFVNGEL